MREIKFRMFFDATGYVDKFPDHPDCGTKRMIEWDELLLEADDPIRAYFNNEIDGCSPLMQYTGLKDKNGKEIYEGDILDLHSTVNGVNLFEIYYNESQARFSIKYHTNRMPKRSLEYEYSVSDFFKPCQFSGEVEFEIVGNIHENPELLK